MAAVEWVALSVHANELFVDRRIDVTRSIFLRCTFDGCVLVLSECLTYMDECNLNQCSLEGVGWPEEVLQRAAVVAAAPGSAEQIRHEGDGEEGEQK